MADNPTGRPEHEPEEHHPADYHGYEDDDETFDPDAFHVIEPEEPVIDESIPMIEPRQAKELLEQEAGAILLDVREQFEVEWVRLDGPQVAYAAMSILAHRGEEALPPALADKSRPVVVFCHVGIRSAQVTQWLRDLGWERVYSMVGGIDAYAREVDPSLKRY